VGLGVGLFTQNIYRFESLASLRSETELKNSLLLTRARKESVRYLNRAERTGSLVVTMSVDTKNPKLFVFGTLVSAFG
jgi:hypothetical protein